MTKKGQYQDQQVFQRNLCRTHEMDSFFTNRYGFNIPHSDDATTTMHRNIYNVNVAYDETRAPLWRIIIDTR